MDRKTDGNFFRDSPENWDDYLGTSTDELVEIYAQEYNLSIERIKRTMKKLRAAPEEAVEELIKRDDEKCFCVNGRLYKSVTSACKDLNFSNKTIKKIADNNGISLREAVQLWAYLKTYQIPLMEFDIEEAVEIDDQYLNI